MTQALQIPTSTPTQDGPAATTPTKVYVPAASASTGVYESAATPTAESCNMQQLCYISINWSLSASTQTEARIQQLGSASTGVSVPFACTPTEAYMQQLVQASTITTIVRDATIEEILLLPTDDCVTITFYPAANRLRSLLAACKVRVNYSVSIYQFYLLYIFIRSIFLR